METITDNQIVALFEHTYQMLKLSQQYDKTFPGNTDNEFRGNFAGLRKAIDILGLGNDYIKYIAGEH